MSDQWTDRLSEYLDGELAAAERAALEAHLDGCPDCRITLGELRRVVGRAQALEDAPPERDLWPAIARRIGRRPPAVVELASRRARRVSFTVPQLIAAGIALMVVSAGAVWTALGGRGPGPTPVPPAPVALAPAAGTAEAGWRGVARYDAAIADLERVLAQHRTELDTATVRVLEKNLAIIDRAIADARAALAADPSSAYLNNHLARTMRHKLDLLRQASALVDATT
jgi:anti-sigma factor RsiW